MSIIRFEDFGKPNNLPDSKKVENKVVKPTQQPIKKNVAPVVTEKRTLKSIKNKKVVNENAFLVGSDFKVKVVVDVPQSMVKEYIDKVKEETDKDPLDNFSEAEIAEQIITFIIKKNLMIDNLTPEFTVGSENVGNTQKNKSTVDSDAEDLSDDLDIDSDSGDSEIEFTDFDNNDGGDVEIETSSDDADGEIEFENGNESETDEDSDSEFDEFEFEDGDNEEESTTTSTKKTIGDLKKEKNQKIEKKHKEEENSTEEEEENYIDDTTDIYRNIGYKVGYHEQLANLISKNNYLI
jgi:hypothetical protein